MIAFNLFLGALIRLYNLGKASLWFDEAESVLSAIPPTQVAAVLKANYPAVLYKVFIFYWKFFGSSEFALRLSSVIFGVLCLAVVYYLARLFFPQKTALLGSFILAISSFHVYYSQELRPYALMTLLTACSVYCFIRALREGRVLYWAGYVFSGTLNIYNHPAAFGTPVCLSVYYVLYCGKYKKSFKPWILTTAATLLLSAPIMAAMFSALELISDKNSAFYKAALGWIHPLGNKTTLMTLKNFSVGYSLQIIKALPLMLIYALAFLYGLTDRRHTEHLVLISIMFFLPILTLLFMSSYYSCYIDRYLISSSIFFYLIVANGLSRIRVLYRAPVIGFILLFTFFALRNHYDNRMPGAYIEHVGIQEKKQERQAAAYMMDNIRRFDGIIHTCINTTLPFEYYFKYAPGHGSPGFKDGYLQLVSLPPADGADKLAAYSYVLVQGEIDEQYVARPFKGDLDDFERIWVVFSRWDFESATHANSPELKIIKWMDAHYARQESREFSGLTLYLYAKEATPGSPTR